MRVVVISGRQEAYRGEAGMVVMPGRDGEFSVQDFHQPFLYRLRKGKVKIRSQVTGHRSQGEGKEMVFGIGDGLARFMHNDLLILCE